jgi:hypothetical protein
VVRRVDAVERGQLQAVTPAPPVTAAVFLQRLSLETTSARGWISRAVGVVSRGPACRTVRIDRLRYVTHQPGGGFRGDTYEKGDQRETG